MRRVLLAWAVVVAAIGLAPVPARADAPRDHGWWTLTNPGGLPTTPPAPPDVPAGGLLIQAGPGGPSAFAALLYELGPGTSAGKLTLAVAPNSGTTPMAKLQLCPLLQPINHPEAGGPMSDAPPYNCGKSVGAGPSTDGKSYEFDAGGLVSDNLVAVAILPADPVERVVFSAPDANSLATQPGSSDTASSGLDSGAATSPSDAGTASSQDTASGLPGTISSPTFADSVPGASATGPTSVSPAPAAAPPATGGNGGAFVPAVSSGPEEATPLLVVMFVIGALGGAVLWLYAGRQRGSAVLSGPAPG